MQTWFSEVVADILEVKWYTWVIVVALIVMAVVLLRAGRGAKWNSRHLASAAMCIAIAFVLSGIRLFRLPQGGSITAFSMLPLILFAVAFGPVQGAVAGCAYGILQLIQDPYVIHPLQLLVDYPFAFGALALGGLVNFIPVKDSFKLPLAVVLATLGRYAMAVVSGTVFFAEYAPVGQNALFYSLGYNLGYLGPDALLCLIAAFIPTVQRLTGVMKSGRG